MSDSGLIIGELERAASRSEPVVLASIVRTEGSAYRGVGTRMVVRGDGSAAGLVSGGCLEADLVERARAVRTSRTPVLVTYDSRSDDDLVWGLGLGCDGLVQVLLEPLAARAARELAALLRTAQAHDVAILVTDIGDGATLGARILFDTDGRELARTGTWDDDAAMLVHGAARSEGHAIGRRGLALEKNGVRIALELVRAPMELVICGGGPDVAPVASLAAAQGWNVTVVDHRAIEDVKPERFPTASVRTCASPESLGDATRIGDRTAVIVMSHNYPRDLEYVAAALRSHAAYVGALGPRRRTERMLAELAARGETFGEDVLARLHAPIGLDVGGDGPEAIALSIIAEVMAVSSGRAGGFLRERNAPIHDPALP